VIKRRKHINEIEKTKDVEREKEEKYEDEKGKSKVFSF
jgi:hypothetical protein